MLHPDLQKLLDFALESGEVTEKHRQVLHNKAAVLNQDIDELDMIIEGEIKRLKKSNEGEKQKSYACPNCGYSIPNSSIKCNFCGFEISKSKTTGEDYIAKLQSTLSKLDDEWDRSENTISYKGIKGDPYGTILAEKKASTISTFTMPNDKEQLIEFFYFCDTNSDSVPKVYGITYDDRMKAIKNNTIRGAWIAKAKLGYLKLKRYEDNDNEIKTIIEKFKKKYHQEASDLKAVSINTNQGSGKEVLMGLNQTGAILFFVLLVLCFPTCWLPFVIPSCKAG